MSRKRPQGPEPVLVRWEQLPNELLGVTAKPTKDQTIKDWETSIDKRYHDLAQDTDPLNGGDKRSHAFIMQAYAMMTTEQKGRVPGAFTAWHARERPDTTIGKQDGTITLCGKMFPTGAELTREGSGAMERVYNKDKNKTELVITHPEKICQECLEAGIFKTYRYRTEA